MTFVLKVAVLVGDVGVMEDTLKTDRVVVGVDGSASSIDALRYAVRIADALDAPLEAVTVWTYPPFADNYINAEWPLEEEARLQLHDAVQQAFGLGQPAGLTLTVLPGPVAATLIELSRRSGMLVLGSRGRGGFVGLVLGSVSAACAAHAHCPVLIVRSPQRQDSPAPRRGQAN